MGGLQARLQVWLASLPMSVRAAVFLVTAVPLVLVLGFDIDVAALLGHLRLVGAVAVVAAGGSGYLWMQREKRKRERQAALNRELPGSAAAYVILPPRQAVRMNWKSMANRAETFAAFLSNALRQFPDMHVSLEIIGGPGGTVFQVWAPQELEATVLQGAMSAFPEAQIRKPQDVLNQPDAMADLDPQTQWVELGLAQAAGYPLKQAGDYQSSSLGYILAAMSREPKMGRLGVLLICKAPDAKWARLAQKDLRRQREGLAQQRGAMRASGDTRRLKQLESKADTLTGMAVNVVVFAEPQSTDRLGRLLMATMNTSRGAYNSLTEDGKGQTAKRAVGRHYNHKIGKKVVLSAEEVAPLWHVPLDGTGDVITSRGAYIAPPPEVISIDRPPFSPDYRILGQGLMKTGEQVFIKWNYGFDSLVHGAIIGATGAGKSTLMHSLMTQDACAGQGFILLEPHRNLTLDLIESIPPERGGDVVWINPVNPSRSWGINLLEYGSDLFLAVLRKIVGGAWDQAPRMAQLLSNGTLAVLEGEEHPTMWHLLHFLRQEAYRNTVIEKVENPVVRDFWTRDFAEWNASQQTDAMSPVFRRVEPLMRSRIIRHVMAQQSTTLPMLDMMSSGKIILIDLTNKMEKSDGRRQEPVDTEALGTMIVALAWAAASSRTKEHYPIPTWFWIDEAQRYITEDMVDILAEARGFGLGLYLATQYYRRLPDWMQKAILTNCRTKIVGGVESPDEAKGFRDIYQLPIEMIMSMEAYTWLGKLAADRRASDPFTLKAFPPVGKGSGKLDVRMLHQAYRSACGGRMPQPEDHGADPLDFFTGVEDLTVQEQKQWHEYQQRLDGSSEAEGARFLADLGEQEWGDYRRLRRSADKQLFHRIREKPEAFSSRAQWTRQLSSLQVEVPRQEIEAERLRIEDRLIDAADELDYLLTL